MWQIERKNILTGEIVINEMQTVYNIKDGYGETLADFLSLYCEFAGEKITIFSPTHNDELTIIKLAFSEEKGYYNQYASN